MAVDALPFAHPLRVGMIGSYGNRWANLALSQSDLLLVLGSRLDVRQTGSNTDAFKAGRIIFHVDCEEAETNNRVKGCESILSNLADFVPRFLEEIQDQSEFLCQRYRGWSREVDALRAEWPDTDELAGVNGINPNVFMHGLSRRSHDAAVFVADVGQHQMWAAQSLELDIDQRFMTSGGMGSMGFGLPAAIGAVLSASGRPVVLIAGDGGFQCNIQELQTVVRLNLPIKIIVINNQCHGMVRQFQQSYFEGRYPGTYWGYSAPDFARIANAYGLFGLTVDDPDQVDEMLNRFWEEPSKPVLLQVMIDTFANAYPKIAFGRPINEMEPFSQPIEMEST
jgi:acetolactate synthase-1/2/3 large subunit